MPIPKPTPITVTTKSRGGDSEEVETHPAFGLISFSRITGRPGKMFGSHLNDHAGYIQMTVRQATRHHNLSRDWFFGRKHVIELNLTHVQFAELITTMNVGEGTPCTLTHLESGPVPSIPDDMETEQEKVTSGFKDHTSEFGDKVKERFSEVETILNKPSIGKKDREVIRDAIRMVLQDIKSGMPFVLESFVESTEKATHAAKAEVEGFLTSAAHQLGVAALKDKLLETLTGEPKKLKEGK